MEGEERRRGTPRKIRGRQVTATAENEGTKSCFEFWNSPGWAAKVPNGTIERVEGRINR